MHICVTVCGLVPNATSHSLIPRPNTVLCPNPCKCIFIVSYPDYLMQSYIYPLHYSLILSFTYLGSLLPSPKAITMVSHPDPRLSCPDYIIQSNAFPLHCTVSYSDPRLTQSHTQIQDYMQQALSQPMQTQDYIVGHNATSTSEVQLLMIPLFPGLLVPRSPCSLVCIHTRVQVAKSENAWEHLSCD